MRSSRLASGKGIDDARNCCGGEDDEKEGGIT